MSAKDHLVSVFETIHKDYPWAVSVRDYNAKDDILVEDDDDDDDVYLIREGKATVIIGGGQSEFILGKDDLIGEMSFLLGNKRTASIVAKEDVTCWAVSVSNMEKIFEVDLALAARFYRSLGALLALRLVNTSKRSAQKLLFQNTDDALIALMRDQTKELLQHLLNLTRSVESTLRTEIKRISKSLALIDSDPTITLEDRRSRNRILEQELEDLYESIFIQKSDKFKGIFDGIQHMLLEIMDLEKRHEVGVNAEHIFSTSVLKDVSLFRLRKENQVEPLELVLDILHPPKNNLMWTPKEVLVGWLERILHSSPTMVAFRNRHYLMADVISGCLLGEVTPEKSLLLVEDVVGVILARVHNQLARSGVKTHLAATDPYSLYHVEYGLTNRIATIPVEYHRIPSILALVLEDGVLNNSGFAPQSQSFIAINGLINYLPDRYLVQMIERLKPLLANNGTILVSGLLPTSDQSLFTDFFQWTTIRRRDTELQQIFDSLGFDTEIHTRQGAIVVQAKMKIMEKH